MQKDIRALLKNYKGEKIELSSSHANKFEELLKKELHKQQPKKKTYKWLSIAASIFILMSLTIQYYKTTDSKINENTDTESNSVLTKEITLGTISPEFNTIETYYVNSINLEISKLEISEDNKELIDSYLLKIAKLTKEYKSLTKELNTNGINDATIDALIRNLQLRLQLLKRLKKQLNEFKNVNNKQNETQII